MCCKKIIIACIGTVALTTGAYRCGPNLEQPTLSDEKIARVMADLYIAEAATTGLAGQTKDSLTQIYYNQVFQIHELTPAEYEKNLQILAQENGHIERVVSRSVELVDKEKKKTGLDPNAEDGKFK